LFDVSKQAIQECAKRLAMEAGFWFGEIAPVFRRMETALRSRHCRVSAKSFGVTVKRVSPKVFAAGGISFGQNLILQSATGWRF
jgi:hypothetical protein